MGESVRSERNRSGNTRLGLSEARNPGRILVVALARRVFMQLGQGAVLYESYSDHP
jgi:hypothetical protein